MFRLIVNLDLFIRLFSFFWVGVWVDFMVVSGFVFKRMLLKVLRFFVSVKCW